MPVLSSKKVKNRYQLKERLRTGGMGIVYRARDVVINADVALKTLADTTDPIALRMFREECDKLAKIVHPNVVEIRDVGEIEEDGTRKPYLVMPFLRGKTLDSIILDAPDGLVLERALEILMQASRGLQATHEAGLIHRDIKPSNIFVLDDDSVKLIDFGVAHYAENLLTVTRKGTLLYMAPEQIMMQGISPLSDIFSLGVVAYETLTGRRPFEGRTEKDLIDRIVHRNPQPASSFNPQLNFAIDQTIQKALAKLPEYRFQSAREFGETLRKAELNQLIKMFDAARIEPYIEQARDAVARGDLGPAGEVLNQLERQGWLNDRITEVKQEFEHISKQRAIASLLASARERMPEREYALAAGKVDDALRLDPKHAEAISLREEIERRHAESDVAELLEAARTLVRRHEFGDAKEAVEQALEICPNELAALELRSIIQQDEQEYSAVLGEKHRATRRAEQAIDQCDPAKAWDEIQRALALESQAPEPGDGASDLANLSTRIRSASRDARHSLDRARELLGSDDLDAALACCEEALSRLPEHTELRRLKLDIEEAQREQTARQVADAEREIESEPDLDRRIEMLKLASERFSQVEHFGSSYRAACEKRDFAESLAAKARAAEQEHRLGDALAGWKLVCSVHPGFQGVDAEITRLEEREDLKTDNEGREDLLRQLRTAIETREFAGALHLLRTAEPRYQRDPTFIGLRSAARDGAKREKLAGDLLDAAAQLGQDGHYDDALRKLDEAAPLDVREREIVAARHRILVEHAQSVMDSDWLRAEILLKQALELAPGRNIAHRLIERVQERRREEHLNEMTDRIRHLQTTHDLAGALRVAEQALAENPGDFQLAQTAAQLRRRRDRQVGHPPRTPDTSRGRAFLQAAWEKASAIAHGPRANPDANRQQAPASLVASDERSAGGGVASADKTPTYSGAPPAGGSLPRVSKFPTSFRISRRTFRINGAVLAFSGGILAAAILLALWLERRSNHHVAVVAHPVLVSVPRPPALAQLSLKLDPADAQVTVDGSPVSLQDGTLVTKPGTHVLDVRSPGFRPLRRSVEIAPRDNAPLQIALVSIPVPPAINIETDLESGTVALDGKRVGTLEAGRFSHEAPDGSHSIAVLAPDGGRYFFLFTLAKDPVWSATAPKSTAYGTPILATLAGTGVRIVCGRQGLSVELDGGHPAACTTAGLSLPPLSGGSHTLTLLKGSRTIAVHTLDYKGAPVLAALITTGAQFGGLAIEGTEDTFTVSINGYTSKRAAKEGHWRRLLKPGDYTIAVSKPGFNATPSSIHVSIAPGVDALEQVSFAPVPVHARLRLQSQPGTEVDINGKPAGTVPEDGILDLAQLAAGNAVLRLHRNGFADAQQTITLGNGENQRAILLEELKSKIEWTSDPPNAQVSYSAAGNALRHQLTGNSIELPAGTYSFEASAPGRTPVRSVVTVGPGDTKSLTLDLGVASPAIRTVDVWPGWGAQGGLLVREKPGPTFHALPEHASRIAFTAQWERQKTLVHWFGGALNLVVRTADNTRSITFRITEHGISWSAVGQSGPADGKLPFNLGKRSETIEAAIRTSGVALTVNGTPLAAAGPDLVSESKALQFGFIIEADQVVRLSAVRVTSSFDSSAR